jgi:hypothetical protein
LPITCWEPEETLEWDMAAFIMLEDE